MFEPLLPTHRYRVLTIRWGDGLQFGSGMTQPADAYCCVFLLYPMEALLPGEAIREETIDLVWQNIYGRNWRAGNEDGSCYVILVDPEVNYPDRPFTHKIATLGQLQLPNQRPDQLWFYQLDLSGVMTKLTPAEFLARMDVCQFPAIG